MQNRRKDTASRIIEPQVLINAYSNGFFPMAEGKEGEIFWHSPDPRAIIPLDKVKMPRTLRQAVKKEGFEFRIDSCFGQVIIACSEREDTWISQEIIDSYIILHKLGFAHSVESFKDGELAGGLYGVAIGGAFFGESMYTSVTNASKAAFYQLAEHLISRGFILLDTQYINDFTESLGAVEIPRYKYMSLLGRAIGIPCKF
jgi:leucyl/phenylalanyl-tRNA--protein transferase